MAIASILAGGEISVVVVIEGFQVRRADTPLIYQGDADVLIWLMACRED
jgi:hypothetical protein